MPLLQCSIAERALVMSAPLTHLDRQGEHPDPRGFQMAHVASNTTVFPSPALRAQADRLFARIGQGFNAYLELRSRSAEIQYLTGLSDGELAARGITRDGIVQHVFRDRLAV